ncbi:unnamed protein product [Schistosoma turkestanicum]|nr:unnamed protein product [Schistosoma turkestanicum]
MSNVIVRMNEFTNIWPILLDYDQRECLQILRRLELEAYSKIVAVLRAQGPLTEEKKKLLHKLQRLLSISIDRHKAEVRKALNDEELATISEAVCGKEVDEEWILEGKRISPIFQRPSPETIFISQANKASFEQLIRNSRLPYPSETATFSETLINLSKLHGKIDVNKQQSVEKKSSSIPLTNDQTCDQSVVVVVHRNESETMTSTALNDSQNNMKSDEKCLPVKAQNNNINNNNNPLVKSLLQPKTTITTPIATTITPTTPTTTTTLTTTPMLQSPPSLLLKDNDCHVVEKGASDDAGGGILPPKLEKNSSSSSLLEMIDSRQHDDNAVSTTTTTTTNAHVEIPSAKHQSLSNQFTVMPTTVVVTREYSTLKSENASLVNCMNDMSVLDKLSNKEEVNNHLNSIDTQITLSSDAVSYVNAKSSTPPYQSVLSQINRIPMTTNVTTNSKLLHSSNYPANVLLHQNVMNFTSSSSSLPSSTSSSLSAHTSQHLVVQMHRNPDVLLDSNPQVFTTTTQRCSLLNPTNNSMYLCENTTPTMTRLCSTVYTTTTTTNTTTNLSSHMNNFTTNYPSNKLYQSINRSNFDNNVIAVVTRHQQQSFTPSVLSVQSLHNHNTTPPSQRFRSPPQSHTSIISTNDMSKQFASLTQLQNPKILKATTIPATSLATNIFSSGSMINITTDHLPIANHHNITSNTNNHTDQSYRTSLLPQNTLIPSSSVVQFPSSISGNNVIVLHKGVVARKTFTPTSSIRIGSTVPFNNTTTNNNNSSTQPILSGNNNYSNASSMTTTFPPGRQFRIIGLSNNNNNTPGYSNANIVDNAVYNQESSQMIRNIHEITSIPNPPTLTPANMISSSSTSTSSPSSSSLSSQLLHHASRLGSILEVDLDSDNYHDQINFYADYQNVTAAAAATATADTLKLNHPPPPPPPPLIHHHYKKSTMLTAADEFSVVNLPRSTTDTNTNTTHISNTHNDLHNTTSSGLYTIISDESLSNSNNNNNRLTAYSESGHIIYQRDQFTSMAAAAVSPSATFIDSSQKCIEFTTPWNNNNNMIGSSNNNNNSNITISSCKRNHQIIDRFQTNPSTSPNVVVFNTTCNSNSSNPPNAKRPRFGFTPTSVSSSSSLSSTPPPSSSSTSTSTTATIESLH